jgi:hypothetical protein
MDAKTEQRSLIECSQGIRVGPHKYQVGDLIIHYKMWCGPVHPVNLITVQDANSNQYFRQMPAGLIEVQRAAIQMYGDYKERIRCGDCGARKIPQALSNGRCGVCNEKFWKGYIPEKPRGSPYLYPEGTPEARWACR